MPEYRYTATNRKGKEVRGRMTAMDESDLHLRLKAEDLYLTSCRELGVRKDIKPLTAIQLSGFARQIATLSGAGVSLVRALNIIAAQETLKPKEKMIYEDLLRLIRQGFALSDAMEQQNGAFPLLMINMFRAAETSGNLDKTAMRMADHYDKEHRLNSKVKSSMTYPKILCVLIVVVVIVIMGYVLPQFESLFAQMDSLPAPTRVLMAISDFMAKYWPAVAVVGIIAVIGIRFLFKIPAVLYRWHKLLVKLPVIGKLQKTIYTARFARTLSSLYSSGIPIVTSLQIARKTIGNSYIEAQFDKVIATVRGGANLSEALEQVDGFIRKLAASIRVGEETGSMDTMLNATADELDYESEMAIGRMVSYLEPAMIVVMALVVGFIMIAVITPIYGSYETIGGTSY